MTERETGQSSTENTPPAEIQLVEMKDINPPKIEWSKATKEPTDVLLVVVNSIEFRAAYKILDKPKSADSKTNLGKVYFGQIGENNVALVWSSMGPRGNTGMERTCRAGIEQLKAKTVISVGMCFGMRDSMQQKLGDVIVSTMFACYEHTRVTSDGSLAFRGTISECSERLTRLFRDGKAGWNSPVESDVRCGLMISGSKFVDNVDFKQKLQKLFPEALAGEMEGEGLKSACEEPETHKRPPWIICKAIADWGNGTRNKECRQLFAAVTAASYVKHVLEQYYVPGKEGNDTPTSATENTSNNSNNAGRSDEQTRLLNNDQSTLADELGAGSSENLTARAANGSDGNSNTGEDSEGFPGSTLSVNLRNIRLFEDQVMSCFEKKVRKYEDNAERPAVGKKTEIANTFAQGSSFATGITATVVGLTVTTAATAAAATGGTAGPVILGTALIGKYVVEVRRREKCKRVLKPMKELTKWALECIVLRTAKELSRIFEFQISMLKDNRSVKRMAERAVNLMVALKKNDVFDVNTLLKKVLGSKGPKIWRKKDLKVKSIAGKVAMKWKVRSIFWKTGLREYHDPERGKNFLYWERHDSRAEKYGFRGEIFVAAESDTTSIVTYYSKSDIDEIDNNFNIQRVSPKDEDGKHKAKNKTNKHVRRMSCCRFKDKDCKQVHRDFFDYKPYHCLLLHYEDLKRFSTDHTDHTPPTLANFVRAKYQYPENQPVKPVFRPLEPMTEPLNLNKTNLRESDLSGANFAGFQLKKCDFSKCEILSGNFEGAFMKGARFQGAYLFDCILDGAKAQKCFWSQAKLYHCQVYRTDFRKPKDQLSSEPWHGTDLDTSFQNDEDLRRIGEQEL